MTEKQQAIKEVIEGSKENETKLKVIMLQGVFDCLLIRKLPNGQELEQFEVKTLKNNHPDYQEENVFTINIKDKGLIKIEKL